jgi:aspartyl-tRNA(Asn)/glutamyl-tRNA(Gln) amidotransferase subunit A
VTIAEIGRRLRARELSVRELTEHTLAGIEREQPRLNAFITVTGESALARAAELDALLARGDDLGPLHGIPVAHKDCFFTKGVRTTAGSRVFADFVPDRDAEVVHRLHAAGMVMVGKTNLHELTYGITSINAAFGTVHNPHHATRVSGGSSGGSGAAISAGLVPGATGTDTGGSIRIPASFCGCVGLKPTYDRISRDGVMPLGPSQDHVGPIAANIADTALLYAAMAGVVVNAEPGVHGLRIGLPENYFWENLAPEVRFGVRGAVQVIGALGALPREVRVPDVAPLMEVARITLLFEAAASFGGFDPNLLGDDVRARVEEGRRISAEEYQRAQELRAELAREFALLWRDLDLLVTPTTPMTAFPIEGSEDLRPEATRLTRPFNLLGWPALSLPCGVSSEGLPIGVQLVAAPGNEDVLFRAGAAIEAGVKIPIKKRQ